MGLGQFVGGGGHGGGVGQYVWGGGVEGRDTG